MGSENRETVPLLNLLINYGQRVVKRSRGCFYPRDLPKQVDA